MDFENTAFIIFTIVIGLGLGAAALAFRQTARKRLERLSPAFELGTCRSSRTVRICDRGSVQGLHLPLHDSIRLAVRPGRSAAPDRRRQHQPWSAEPANTGSRLLVKFGSAKDFDIGDRVLDERFRFSAEDEGVLRSIFGTESARDAMHTLAATENFKCVGAREDRIDFQWAPRNRHLDEDTETLRFRLETATNLATACNLTPRFGN